MSDTDIRVIKLDNSRAKRRGGLVFWLPRVVFIVPPVIWLLMIVAWGLQAPIFFALCVALAFSLLVLPALIAAIGGQRNMVRARVTNRSVVFPATDSDRYVYSGLALAGIAAAFVVPWDLARVGEQTSVFAKSALVAMFLFSAFGLFAAPRMKSAYLSLDNFGVETRVNNHVSRVDWTHIPPIGATRRAMKALGIPNPAYLLRSDPEIVMDMVEFYRANPNLRHEVATGKALDRLERGDLPRRGAPQPTAPADQ